MLNAGLLNVPISGSIFQGDPSLFKTNIIVNNYFTNLALHFPTEYQLVDSKTKNPPVEANPPNLSPVPKKLTKPDEPNRLQATSSNDDATQPPTAPFLIETTLVFADPTVLEFQRLALPSFPLFVMPKETMMLKLDPQPAFSVTNTAKGVTLLVDRQWHVKSPRQRFPPLREYPNRERTSIPKMRVRSQMWWGENLSVTLYRAPLDEIIIIADQKYIFSSTILSGLYVLIMRKLNGRDSSFVRQLALVGLPRGETK